MSKTTKIGVLLYEGFDSLDVAGASQVFYFFQEFSSREHPVILYLIGPQKGGVVTSNEGFKWVTDIEYSDITEYLDLVFVPGGGGGNFAALLENPPAGPPHKMGYKKLLQNADNQYDDFYNFLENQVKYAAKAKAPQIIASVCTGALLLARAGLLEGYECTTHWALKSVLSLFPGVIVAPGFPRFVVDRNRVTGGGISSGIDEALAIVEILRDAETARKIQLIIQYAPNPPFHSGDPSEASASTMHSVSNFADSGKLYETIKALLNGKN